MSGIRLFLAAVLLTPPIGAQSADAAARLRDLLRDTPRLPVEQIPIASRMANAESLGTVSSVAADRNGVIYVLQRGDKADPLIAVTKEGRMLRSWGKGMFNVPHSVRIDAEGDIWTVDAGSSVLLKFSPEGKNSERFRWAKLLRVRTAPFRRSVGPPTSRPRPTAGCLFPTATGTPGS